MVDAQTSPDYPCSRLERQDFQRLLDALHARGYEIIGPTRHDTAIVYDVLTQVEDLPIGWTEEQEGGYYRLSKLEHGPSSKTLFGYTIGPQAWKRYLLPPQLRLWQAVRTNGKIEFLEEAQHVPKYAFLGVRACDLRAIQIQDRIFMQGGYQDPDYSARRDEALIIAVNCGQAAQTCFCASMGSGPEATTGFDLALTEVLTAEEHYFVVEIGSERGLDIFADVPHRKATPAELDSKARIVAEVVAHMGRTLETTELKQLLYRNLEHPHWNAIAERCLACGNCTMVCPTCFCTTVEDVTDVTGQQAERWRKTDSCFSVEFSHIYGGSIRASTRSRYRQWMTHKLASWVDQFGEFGCVGCGRCITWCPVGIDITEEVRLLQAAERAAPIAGEQSIQKVAAKVAQRHDGAKAPTP